MARQEFETNQTRLQASLRIAELQVKRLESQLEQKVRYLLVFYVVKIWFFIKNNF